MTYRSGYYWSLLLLFVGLVAAAGNVMAADTFSIEPLAQSNAGYDFGRKIINWITYGAETGTHGERSLLSVVSLTLCTISLVMMAALSVLGGVTYVIQTANKGVPGGQVVSSFWMPLRISVATILMVPLSSGFSTIQYGVTSIAIAGNNHANVLMEKGLDYLYDFGAYRPISLLNGEEIIFGWIGSEVCRQYINAYTKTETILFKQVTVGNVTQGFSTKFQYSYKEPASSFRAANARSEYCGSINVTSPAKGDIPDKTGPMDFAEHEKVSSSMASSSQKSLVALVSGLQPTVAAIAAKIMADQSSLQAMQSSGQGAQSTFESALAEARGKAPGLSGEIGQLIATFNDGRQAIVATAVNEANTAAKKEGDWKKQTIDAGWAALGTVFWQISINQQEINSLSQLMTVNTIEPQMDKEWLEDQRLQELSQRLLAAKKAYGASGTSLLKQSADSLNQPIPSLSAIASAGAEGTDLLSSMKMALYAGLSSITKKALQRNSPDDLLVNIQYIGSAIGTGAEVMYMSKAATITGMTFAASSIAQLGDIANSNILGFLTPVGLGANTVAAGGKVTLAVLDSITQSLLPMVDTILSILIGIGFVAGVVLPTIPLSIWFMGVISWMLFYIECLLVCMFWLAAHGTADREGWGTEHTRQGYMLMIGLYLAPILRVAGFFAIFIALRPLSTLVSWFFDYVSGVLESGFVFLFSSIGAVVVCLMFAYSTIVRVFGLPSELFERGLRWINGGQEVTGDGHNEEKVRGNFMAFVGKAEHAASRGAPVKQAVPPKGE